MIAIYFGYDQESLGVFQTSPAPVDLEVSEYYEIFVYTDALETIERRYL